MPSSIDFSLTVLLLIGSVAAQQPPLARYPLRTAMLLLASGCTNYTTRRDKTGKGGVVDIAMTDGVIGFATLGLTAALAGAPPPRGDDVLTGGLAPYQTYFSKDGAAMTLASLEPKFWMALNSAATVNP